MKIALKRASATVLACVLAFGMFGAIPTFSFADETKQDASGVANANDAGDEAIASDRLAGAASGEDKEAPAENQGANDLDASDATQSEDEALMPPEGSGASDEQGVEPRAEEESDAATEGDSGLSMAAAARLPYVTISGTRVTDKNKGNILGDGTCSLRYDSAAARWVLRLENASISASGQSFGISLSDPNAKEFAIELVGANSVAAESYAISASALVLTVSGSGTLEVKSYDQTALYSESLICANVKKLALDGFRSGVNCDELTLANSTVRASSETGYSSAISASKAIVDNSYVTARSSGKGASAFSSIDSLSIANNSIVSCSAADDNALDAGFLSIVDSTVYATSSASKLGYGIFASKDIAITGSTTVVEASGAPNGIVGGNDVTISGATVLSSGSGEDMGFATGIYALLGAITVQDGAKVVAQAQSNDYPEYAKALRGDSIVIGGGVDVRQGNGPDSAVLSDKLEIEYSTSRYAYASIVPKGSSIPGPSSKPMPAYSMRLAGADRYATMAAVSKTAFPNANECSTVVVARGDNFPDALAAAGLAGLTGGQVLLTETNRLTAATQAEIVRLGASKAYVIGDKWSISDATFSSIKALVGGNAERLAGSGREETALKIYEAGKGIGAWGTTAVVATGQKAPDSLSVSPIAYGLSAPIFLTDSSGNLSGEALNAIASGGFTRVLVLGDKWSVSDKTFGKLKNSVYDSQRLAGSDRYQTSKLVADWALGNGFGCASASFTAGRNGKFADALVASSLGGRSKSVLLLGDDVSGGRICVDGVLSPNKGNVGTVYVLGDHWTVSNDLYWGVESAIS